MQLNERDGFLFYRSFYDAVNSLPAKDQLPILKAIILFGLDGIEPDKLTPTQKAFFLLVRPVLAKSRNKAANGKKGGSKTKANGKQNESKPEANDSEKKFASGLLLSDERQGMKDERQGMKDEGVYCAPPPAENAFTLFWNAYPKKVRREEAWEAWKRLYSGPTLYPVDLIMERLEGWKCSKRWTDDNGEFIPNPENFLDPDKGYLTTTPPRAKQTIPKGASGQLGDAELEAIQRVMGERI